jgi:hypothetical protein
MTLAQGVVWIGGLALVVVCIVVALTPAGSRRIVAGLLGVVPIVVAGIGLAFHIDVPAPAPWLGHAMAVALGTLGVVGGGPATKAVLELARRGDAARDEQPNDGTRRRAWFLRRGAADEPQRATPFLRGGAAIGYLERIAVVVAIAVGHLEIVAAVIAVKGLGRFSELSDSIAREQFIIGTLASLTWAGACIGVVVLA